MDEAIHRIIPLLCIFVGRVLVEKMPGHLEVDDERVARVEIDDDVLADTPRPEHDPTDREL